MSNCGSYLQWGQVFKYTYHTNIYSKCAHIIPMSSPHTHTCTPSVAGADNHCIMFSKWLLLLTQLLTKLVSVTWRTELSVIPAPLAYPKPRRHERTCKHGVWRTVHIPVYQSTFFFLAVRAVLLWNQVQGPYLSNFKRSKFKRVQLRSETTSTSAGYESTTKVGWSKIQSNVQIKCK